MMRGGLLAASAAVLFLESFAAVAQTTAGTSATIVIPVIAQTASFASDVTVYNPNGVSININGVFYDAQNTASPGPKACTSLSVGANVSKGFTVAAQCALPSGSNFGLLVLTESTGTQRFYGYARTQTPQGIGFSTEGFPIENFNDQIQHATGLKRIAASGGLPAYQTNCFVATLGDAVSYELRLFDGGTNVQLGSTLSKTLGAFQQLRYLDVFAAAGVAAGNKTNVRAQFTNLTGNQKKLIGFCTVQENTSFSADFRIAKSYGGTPQNAFVQGGNAFGTTALLGTLDNQALTIVVNNASAMRLVPSTDGVNAGVNVINGSSLNSVTPTAIAATIAGGGGTSAGSSLANQVVGPFGTVGGGIINSAGHDGAVGGGEHNTASGDFATVAGGVFNTASKSGDTVAGGTSNTASGSWSTVAGGYVNVASGAKSFAAGANVLADEPQCAVLGFFASNGVANCKGVGNIIRLMANHGFSVDWGPANGNGGGTWWVEINDITPCRPINTYTNAYLSCSGVWTSNSDRNKKENFATVDPLAVLKKVVAMSITHWNYKAEPGVLRMGPMAQDFYAAFGLGQDNLSIAQTDEAGVAFAAIQGLDRLEQQKDAKIDAQQHEIAELRERVSRLEMLSGELEALKRTLTQLTASHPALQATP